MNCKPGDFAFIVRSDFPENIGRIVRVVSAIGVLDYDDGQSLFTWRVTMDGSPAMGYIGGHAMFTGPATDGAITDNALRPIRPTPDLLPAPPVEVTA